MPYINYLGSGINQSGGRYTTDPNTGAVMLTRPDGSTIETTGESGGFFDEIGNWVSNTFIDPTRSIYQDVSGQSAAEAQAKSQQDMIGYLQGESDIRRQNLDPYMQEGLSAMQRGQEFLNPYSGQAQFGYKNYNLMGPYSRGMSPYEQDQFQYNAPDNFQVQQWNPQDLANDPGYQFRMQEGLKALGGQQAAGGSQLSGQASKDLLGYAQGLASQEAGNAYNRFMDQQQFGAGRSDIDRSFGRGMYESDRGFGSDEYWRGTGFDQANRQQDVENRMALSEADYNRGLNDYLRRQNYNTGLMSQGYNAAAGGNPYDSEIAQGYSNMGDINAMLNSPVTNLLNTAGNAASAVSPFLPFMKKP